MNYHAQLQYTLSCCTDTLQIIEHFVEQGALVKKQISSYHMCLTQFHMCMTLKGHERSRTLGVQTPSLGRGRSAE
jgi:hypothetical protein